MQFQLLTAAGVAAACAAAIYKYMSAASASYLVDFYSFRPPSRHASFGYGLQPGMLMLSVQLGTVTTLARLT